MDSDKLHPQAGERADVEVETAQQKQQTQQQAGDSKPEGFLLTDAQKAALLLSREQDSQQTQLHLGELTPERIAAQKLQLQEAARLRQLGEAGRRQSWMETPVAMRGSTPWQQGGGRRASSATRGLGISETAVQGATTYPDSPEAIGCVEYNVPPSSSSPLVTPPLNTTPGPAASYYAPEIPFGTPTRTASWQSIPPPPQSPPPITTVSASNIAYQQPTSEKTADSHDQQSPNPTVSGFYTPHAGALNSPASTTPRTVATSPTVTAETEAPPYPGLVTRKTDIYAPDDLVAIHQQAAFAQGRTPTLPADAVGSNFRAQHMPGQIAHPNQRGYSNQNFGSGSSSSPKGQSSDSGWRTGLFACAPDADTCCLSLVAPCVVHSRTAHRFSRRSEGRDPTDMLGFSSCNASCILTAFPLCCLLPIIQRVRIRHSYKIEGSLLGDVARGCCCCCCAVAQGEREVKGREEDKRKFEGPGGGGGYLAASGEMVYRPGGV